MTEQEILALMESFESELMEQFRAGRIADTAVVNCFSGYIKAMCDFGILADDQYMPLINYMIEKVGQENAGHSHECGCGHHHEHDRGDDHECCGGHHH